MHAVVTNCSNEDAEMTARAIARALSHSALENDSRNENAVESIGTSLVREAWKMTIAAMGRTTESNCSTASMTPRFHPHALAPAYVFEHRTTGPEREAR